MEKRFLIVCLILIGILPIVSAIPTGSIVYGQSEGIVRSTTLPSENVHALAQQEEILTAGQLSVVQQKISAVQSQLDDIKSTTASQRAEITSQLSGMSRELGAIKSSADKVDALQRQVSEIRPALEQPREVIPPMSLIILSIANIILLVVVIVMIYWLRSQYKATANESHVEEHAQLHLTDFIRDAMHKGASLNEIRKRLMQRGWSESKVDDALQEIRMTHAV